MIDTNGGEVQKLTPEQITKMEEERKRHELHSAIGKVVDFCKNHDVSVIITKSDHFIYSGDYDVLGEFIKKLEGTKGDINMKIKGYRTYITVSFFNKPHPTPLLLGEGIINEKVSS